MIMNSFKLLHFHQYFTALIIVSVHISVAHCNSNCFVPSACKKNGNHGKLQTRTTRRGPFSKPPPDPQNTHTSKIINNILTNPTPTQKKLNQPTKNTNNHIRRYIYTSTFFNIMKLLFIGNPGTGKSTLLNALIGKPLFKAGVTLGAGMTTTLQLQQADDGITYGDTPGLADIKLRKTAAAEISKALKSGDDHYKLIFVVTVEAGRVRPADGVTMKLVLDALPPNVPYGIIINKVTKKIINKINSDTHALKTLLACLNEGRDNPTAYIHLYEKLDELEDEDNQVHEPSVGLRQFLDMLPSVRIKPDDVKEVNASEFEALEEKHAQQMAQLRENNKKLQEKLDQDRKQLQQQLDQVKKANEKAAEDARKMKEEHKNALEQARKDKESPDMWKALAHTVFPLSKFIF